MENYIHFTAINKDKLESIFQYGILTKKKQKNNNIIFNTNLGFNGNYYTSLTKKNSLSISPKEPSVSIYNYFSRLENYVGICVKKPKHIYKTSKNIPEILNYIKTPLRYSPYIDEWQTSDTILTEDFILLAYNYEYFLENVYNKEKIKYNLLLLKDLLQEYDLNIPIIDETTGKTL